MFGYLDESGSPGRAMNDNDYLLLSLIIFDSEESLLDAEGQIETLKEKLKLPADYEFHCSRNTTYVQRNFIGLLSKIDFSFITVAIKKDDFVKTASYDRIAKLLIGEILMRYDNLKIEMDSNPTLYKSLRKIVRERNLKKIKLRQNKSSSNVYIQIVDYVANLSHRKLKKSTYSEEWYNSISDKMLSFIKIDDNKK